MPEVPSGALRGNLLSRGGFAPCVKLIFIYSFLVWLCNSVRAPLLGAGPYSNDDRDVLFDSFLRFCFEYPYMGRDGVHFGGK